MFFRPSLQKSGFNVAGQLHFQIAETKEWVLSIARVLRLMKVQVKRAKISCEYRAARVRATLRRLALLLSAVAMLFQSGGMVNGWSEETPEEAPIVAIRPTYKDRSDPLFKLDSEEVRRLLHERVVIDTFEQQVVPSGGFVIAWGPGCTASFGEVCQEHFLKIAAGWYHALGLRPDGTIKAWGDNSYGQANAPEGRAFVAIAAGGFHSLALKADGTVVGWGANDFGQAMAPQGEKFIAIAAGGYHSLGLTPDGRVLGWGANHYGQASPPNGGEFVAIAAGAFHSLALRKDGSIVAWGLNDHGQVTPPEGNEFVAIAAGGFHSLALRKDGTVIAWGANEFGQASPPDLADFRAIDGGLYHSIGLRGDGSVVVWGFVPEGVPTEIPGVGFVDVAAGAYCNYVLSPQESFCACVPGQVTPTGFSSVPASYNSFGYLSSAEVVARGSSLSGLGGYWGGGGGGGSRGGTRSTPEEPFVIPEPGTAALALLLASLGGFLGWKRLFGNQTTSQATRLQGVYPTQ